MAEGHHVGNIVISPYLSEKSPDFNEIWYTTADLEPTSHVTKMINLNNLRWRKAAILKIIFGHDTAADCPISVKFCVGEQFFLEFQPWDTYMRSTARISWSSSHVSCIVCLVS